MRPPLEHGPGCICAQGRSQGSTGSTEHERCDNAVASTGEGCIPGRPDRSTSVSIMIVGIFPLAEQSQAHHPRRNKARMVQRRNKARMVQKRNKARIVRCTYGHPGRRRTVWGTCWTSPLSQANLYHRYHSNSSPWLPSWNVHHDWLRCNPDASGVGVHTRTCTTRNRLSLHSPSHQLGQSMLMNACKVVRHYTAAHEHTDLKHVWAAEKCPSQYLMDTVMIPMLCCIITMLCHNHIDLFTDDFPVRVGPTIDTTANGFGSARNTFKRGLTRCRNLNLKI